MARRFSTGTPLCEGGTASLYTARDLALGRTVVLKVPHGAGSRAVERTFREARALAALRHPGVCQVYEAGFDEGRPFLALEWVEGRSLRELAPGLPLRQRLELVAQVADAVASVHRAGLLHRDLKPENVVVRTTPEGELQPVVVDFGLVRFEDEPGSRSDATLAGTPLGTPGYMAPEQVRGEGGAIDARTDVWGLGALLYWTATGHAPFEGEGAAQVMFQTLHAEPRPPRAWVPSLPADLEAVILQGLAGDPDRRYPGAGEVAADLRRHLAGEPVQARRTGRIARFGRRFRRRPGQAALAAGFALLILTGVVVARSEIARHGDRSADFQRWADDLEWRLRAEAMAPRHDVSKSDERILASVRRVEGELEELKGPAEASARVALGRVWAALREDAKAEKHLRAAWGRGRREPEVAYTLGLVLGRRYETAMARAARIASPALRAERERQLDRELRSPARAFLARAGGARLPVPAEYPQLLISAHDGRFEEALATLADLRRRVPWFYEAWITEAGILQARSTNAYARGASEEALALLERARAAYGEALAGGQSDPVVYEGLCGTETDIAGLRQELALPVQRQKIEGALAVCSLALQVAPRHATTLSAVGRAHELAARYYQFHEGQGERARALLDRAATLIHLASDLDPTRSEIQSDLLTTLVTQSTFGQLPDAAWLERLERSSRGLEADLRKEHGSLDFVLLLQAYNSRQQWTTRNLLPPGPDLERLVRGYTEVHERTPRSPTIPATLVYALRTVVQAHDLYGEPTPEQDRQMIRLAEEAVAGNPRFVDPQTSLAVALTYNGTARCVRGEEWEPYFGRAETTLATVRALDQARVLANVRTAWVRVAAAQCALARGEDARPRAGRAERTATHAIALSGNGGMTLDLRRTAQLTLWRALLADPRTPASELARAARQPPVADPEPTPLSTLSDNESLLTRADLALELGEDPGAWLDGVELRLKGVEAGLKKGARRPLALDRQRALLRYFRALTTEDPIGRAAQAESAAQLLDLPLTGSRADLGWLYWRRRIARREEGRGPAGMVLAKREP